MTVVQPGLELTTGTNGHTTNGHAKRPLGVFTRPQATTGWKSWLFTVDHKRIGVMYGAAALVFFLVGGCEALLIRIQLARPDGKLLSGETYNQVYTMHGVTMIFLAAMPLAAAFANYLIPLQIGARDVAFPRLNALSFWIFLAGGLFLNSSWIFGGGADGGWFNYAPNSGLPFSPGHGIDFYALGLQITGFASLIGAINLVVTIINMRSPGMTMFRMPVFTWMMLVVQMLLVFAMPVISIALFLLTFDRLFDANFFNVAAGADPLLWQHLFWIFGHPEVYILVLPAFGIISEIIPVFARKPIFGYHFMVFSGIAIGFVGWGVWAHHMFVSGIGPVAVTAFSMSTMIIAIPTGVKILNWIATLWGGKLRFTTPMLYATSVVAMFTVGGLSGVTHAMAAADTQQTDTYYIVAHFHYVIFGGIILGLFGGMFFWWPKVFGFMLSERGGKVTFWTMITGMNMTFGPMHILGLEGMSRRIDTYSKGFGFEFWNMVVSIGAFVIATSVFTFLVNVAVSTAKYKKSKANGTYVNPGPDPWDARSLEWMIPSPAPADNFDEDIEVHGLDEFWHRKYGYDENHRVVRIATSEQAAQKGDAKNVHLPSPSYWPIVIAAGLPIIGYGLIYNLWLCALGGLLTGGGIFGFALEPPDDPDAHGHHDDHDDDHGGEHALEATTEIEEVSHG